MDHVIFSDNKKKSTLVAIHGYNSSKNFIGQLANKDNKFNVLSFSMPGSLDIKANKQVTIDEVTNSAIKYLKKLKHTNIYVLAHSFGGIIINEVTDRIATRLNKKIKGIIYLATFTPPLKDYIGLKLFNTLAKPENKKEKIVAKGISVGAKIYKKFANTNIDSFLDMNNEWRQMLQESKNEQMATKLNYQYQTNKDRSIYIVGNDDKIISTSIFTSYVENSLGKPVNIVSAKHNPLKTSLTTVMEIINKFIPDQKRLWLWRRIYKK